MLSVNWQVIKPVLNIGYWQSCGSNSQSPRVNTTQKQYAICSVLAASAFPALVMSEGHLIEEVPKCPLVVEDKAKSHKLQVFKAAATLEAKWDEKGILGKKPVVRKKEKKAAGIKKQNPPLKAASTKKPAAEKKPAEKKLTAEEKKPAAKLQFVSSIKVNHFGQLILKKTMIKDINK
uniref:Uncharacterized protein n=1 Tax=Pipistrellus kuhlii TaxID=59472 RepID=A0A7J8B2N5_PIPKU|nr:hypothetical protein mPipKuh1_007809 [Pipistrellus kuhlii]